jgi:hypothetical protein
VGFDPRKTTSLDESGPATIYDLFSPAQTTNRRDLQSSIGMIAIPGDQTLHVTQPSSVVALGKMISASS